ncbi:50S ribosome-binding GTPase, partial [Candidatus Saccharibacteria bacterium]|nr:50S ribosome-binding GTPase [Candidatus Saccharibacteria bacterium]
MKLPIVALIGQTNAGKSSLLNRFAHKNIAIVAREEGTTRDSVSTRIDDRFLMIDTAGLKDATDDFEASIQDQISDAIDSADLLLLTLDSSLYPSEKDKRIAKMALKSKKPVFLVLNKSDLGASLPVEEFRSLGIKPDQTFRVSATTGFGIRDLKGAIQSALSASGENFASRARSGGNGRGVAAEPRDDGRDERART